MAQWRSQAYGAAVNRPRRISLNRVDLAISAGLAALFVVEALAETVFAGERLLSVLAGVLFAATLLVRRHAPLLGLAAGLVIVQLANRADPALVNTPTFLIALVIATYSCGRHAQGRARTVNAWMVLIAVPIAAVIPGQAFVLADAVYTTILIVGPFIAGIVVAGRREREQHLEGRTAELEIERDEKAREAVAEERVRIARELHDVVAHAISVMVLQARGGRKMLDVEPEETRAALDAIEGAGEQALDEMRRLLGMLRQGDEQLSLAPQPSLRRIDELVAAVTATGLPLEVTIEGDAFDLPPGIDVSAYRIVQEALTNALKHAGPARAHVILRYSPDALELEISDDGAGTGDGGGSGHGLEGIRERVAVFGGELESGQRLEGGYAVRARLPLGSAR
ncbi:MAG: hypothetical protein QOJ89_2170 [bacterium]